MDEEIIVGLKNGSRDAFKQMYTNYCHILMRQIFSFSKNKEIAEEILHETFITAVQKINFFKEGNDSSFKAWLMRIATNKSIDHLRKIKRGDLNKLDEYYESNEYWFIEKEQNLGIHRELQKLPALQRGALSLRVFEELDYMEISRVLGVSMSSVKQAIFKGKNNLKESLAKSEWCYDKL